MSLEDSINTSGVKSIYTSFMIDDIVLPSDEEEEEFVLDLEPIDPIKKDESIWE